MKLHPAVTDAIVVGVPDEKWGEAITAIVALKPGEQADSNDLADATTEHLARFKRPKHVLVVDEVKRGPNGKADYAWAKAIAKDQLGA